MSAMSNPLSIPAGLPIPGSGNGTAPSRTNAPAQVIAAPNGKPVQLFANPSFRFDSAVGLVVIEFHNDAGNVTTSIPSQRQLAAYRSHQQTPPGRSAPEAAKATSTIGAQSVGGKTIDTQTHETQGVDTQSVEARSFGAGNGDAKTSAG